MLTDTPITEQMVNVAQQAWCDGLVHLGAIDAEGGDVRAAAAVLIDGLYDYAEGTVLFKPTLAFGKNTFRSTARGAISYFVGDDPDYPEDTGFARKRWVSVRYDNNAAENGIQIHGGIAITMGNVYLKSAGGDEVVVDKTFVFRRCSDGSLRLCVHKSAPPYSPTAESRRSRGAPDRHACFADPLTRRCVRWHLDGRCCAATEPRFRRPLGVGSRGGPLWRHRGRGSCRSVWRHSGAGDRPDQPHDPRRGRRRGGNHVAKRQGEPCGGGRRVSAGRRHAGVIGRSVGCPARAPASEVS